MIKHVKLITLIFKLNLKLQCQVYVIVVMHILVSVTITVLNTAAAAAAAASNRKNVTTTNWTLFTNCISKINNSQVAKYICIVMVMCNLTEYSNNSSKTSGSFWYYYGDKPFSNANSAIANFSAVNDNSASFKF